MILYKDKDCETYIYNGWKCILNPEFTGWMFEVYEDGDDESDFDNFYSWSNHPYESKQKALNDFFMSAQCPSDWPDDKFFDGYNENLIPVIISKRKHTRKPKQQRGSLHRAWALLVKNKSMNKCDKCGSKEYLEAHHIESYKDNEELRFSIDNGMTMCNKCHREHHKHNGR